MNDIYNFIRQIIESQGLIAGLLVYLIIQNELEKRAMLAKICELNHFIMKCLDRELLVRPSAEDWVVGGRSGLQTQDLSSEE